MSNKQVPYPCPECGHPAYWGECSCLALAEQFQGEIDDEYDEELDYENYYDELEYVMPASVG